jgi:hypothetical protein
MPLGLDLKNIIDKLNFGKNITDKIKKTNPGRSNKNKDALIKDIRNAKAKLAAFFI